MLSTVGGRKAAACLIALGVCLLAILFKGDVPPGLCEMLKYIVGVYVAANIGSDMVAVAQTHVEKRSVTETVDTTAPVTPPQPDPAIAAALERMAGSITGIQQGTSYIVSRLQPPQPNAGN